MLFQTQIDPALDQTVQADFTPTVVQTQQLPPFPAVSDIRSDLENVEPLNGIASTQNGQIYRDEVSADLSISDGIGNMPLDMFEAELTAFLQGEVPADIWGNWDWQ